MWLLTVTVSGVLQGYLIAHKYFHIICPFTRKLEARGPRQVAIGDYYQSFESDLFSQHPLRNLKFIQFSN